MTKPWDVIVVGAGTAGMPTAIFAAERGARVLMVEHDNRVGGALHYSGGQMAATGTRLHKERGIDDSPEEFLEDIRRISHNTHNEELIKIVTRESGAAIDWLLDLGYQVDPVCPAILIVHEPYMTKRSFWGLEKGLSIINALEPRVRALAAQGKIDLRFETEFVGLMRAANGAITGIETRSKTDAIERHEGANVVVTTGGYAASPEMFARYSPGRPYYSATNPRAKGSGLSILATAGAKVEGGDKVLPSYSCILDDPDDPTCRTFIGGPGDALSAYVWLDTAPQSRLPWEVHVNIKGERFLREDVASVDHREVELRKQPEWRFFIVFDEGVRQNAPKITRTWTDEQLKAALGTHPSFLKAQTLSDLAQQTGMDAKTLAGTLDRYNSFVAAGHDPDFGREFLPRKIAKPPFYAIRCVGMSVMSPAGVVVDTEFRVIDTAGKPIPNLYAAGEILGYARLGGEAFVPGMSVTPALTFGRLLGKQILRW